MRQSSPKSRDDEAESESPLARFRRTLRGLMAVPKSELDEEVAAAASANKRKRQRRAARG